MPKLTPAFKQHIAHEFRLFIFNALFLSIFFTTFTAYRRLILGEYAISYVHYGYGIAESLILSKIILLGQHFKLGERFGNQPLIIPTLYKTLVFGIFVLFFSVLEIFVVGLIHGKHLLSIYQEITYTSVNEIIAKVLVMSLVLALFFAFLEIGRSLGSDNLYNLFFHKRKKELPK